MCSLKTSRCFSQLPIFKSLVFPDGSRDGSPRRGEVSPEVTQAPSPSLSDKTGSCNEGAYLATCHGRFCHPGRVPGAPSDAAAALTRGLGREVA